MMTFHRRLLCHFNVGQGDYDHCRYFKPEGTDIFMLFRAKDRRAKTPLTLGILYEATRMKVWNCQTLEEMTFSSMPTYGRTEDIPVKIFEIKTRQPASLYSMGCLRMPSLGTTKGALPDTSRSHAT